MSTFLSPLTSPGASLSGSVGYFFDVVVLAVVTGFCDIFVVVVFSVAVVTAGSVTTGTEPSGSIPPTRTPSLYTHI